MKRRNKKAQRTQQVLRVWTQAQAEQALPLIASIVQSVREEGLEAQAQHLRAQRLAQRPGHSDRAHLIAHAEAVREAAAANERFESALHELLELHIYCLDPVRGLALIPFAHGDQLAWFVFDLFEPKRLETWRYHEDPLTTRRPIAELQPTTKTDSLII
jgi:Uncharacterized conserved protein (DUF2203)